MLIDHSGISLGEDALSTYYSMPSDTNSSIPTESKSFSTRSSSSERKDHPFLKLRNWLGFGQKNRHLTNENTETVEKIMECFRSNDIPAMDKFVVSETANAKEKDEFWWDDDIKDFVGSKDVSESVPPSNRKHTSRLSKVLCTLPPQVRKSVKFDFDLENTPEDKKTRPFTPLFTSTPKNFDGCIASDESDDEIVTLHYCDSNTVAAPRPVLNNTSSILLTNTSIMGSWHKTLHQTDHALNLALDHGRASDYYKTCFDADDEEMDVKKQETAPSPAQKTFVIARNSPETFSDSESGEKTMSSDENLQHEENDLSTDSSVVLELDRLEDYIRNLVIELTEYRQFSTEKDMIRAREALQNAQFLQGRIRQMNEAITEMCEKMQHSKDGRQVSAAFEDSCWAAQLAVQCGSFDEQL